MRPSDAFAAYQRFHLRLFNVMTRVFGLVALISSVIMCGWGVYFTVNPGAAAGIPMDGLPVGPTYLAIGLLVALLGIAFVRVQPYRPDLGDTAWSFSSRPQTADADSTARRSWWTGEYQQGVRGPARPPGVVAGVIERRPYAAAVLVLIAAATFSVGIFQCVVAAGPYDAARAFIREHPRIVKELGSVQEIELSWRSSATVVGTSGLAQLRCPVRGSLRDGIAFVNLEMEAGVWRVVKANLVLDDQAVPLM